MIAELPGKDTCWALAGDKDSRLHAVVTGTVLRHLKLRVTYRWRTGEVGSATLEDFGTLFEPCTNPQHSPEVAHA